MKKLTSSENYNNSKRKPLIGAFNFSHPFICENQISASQSANSAPNNRTQHGEWEGGVEGIKKI